MSDLTEAEIFSVMRDKFMSAADRCRRMAAGERGDIYPRFREEMALIEGCCRQAAAWRGDTRWLKVAFEMDGVKERCRRWLVEKHPAFKYTKLALILDGYARTCFELQTKATGKIGLILPPVLMPTEHRQNKPVSVILPPGYRPGV